MARIIDESFEGTGYEETWTETVGTGCTCDQDSSGPGSLPSGGGSQCLYISRPVGNSLDVYTLRDYGSTVTTFYLRIYVYFAAYSFSSGVFGAYIVPLCNGIYPDTTTCNLQLRNDSGNYYFRFGYHTTSGWNYIDSSNITTGTWYRLEVKVDNSGGGSYEFLVDGSSQGTGSGNLDRGAVRYFYIGSPTNTNTYSFYADLFTVDDATWVGAEGAGASSIPKLFYHYQNH